MGTRFLNRYIILVIFICERIRSFLMTNGLRWNHLNNFIIMLQFLTSQYPWAQSYPDLTSSYSVLSYTFINNKSYSLFGCLGYL